MLGSRLTCALLVTTSCLEPIDLSKHRFQCVRDAECDGGRCVDGTCTQAAGGGSAGCTPFSCVFGCCDSNDTCQSGSTSTACGFGGQRCAVCNSSEQCMSGACFPLGGGAGGGAAGGTAGGSAGGTAGGNAGGTAGGSAGGTAGGNAAGTAGGSAGSAAGGNAGGRAGGSAGGAAGGNAGGTAGGSAGGAAGGNAGGTAGSGGGNAGGASGGAAAGGVSGGGMAGGATAGGGAIYPLPIGQCRADGGVCWVQPLPVGDVNAVLIVDATTAYVVADSMLFRVDPSMASIVFVRHLPAPVTSLAWNHLDLWASGPEGTFTVHPTLGQSLTTQELVLYASNQGALWGVERSTGEFFVFDGMGLHHVFVPATCRTAAQGSYAAVESDLLLHCQGNNILRRLSPGGMETWTTGDIGLVAIAGRSTAGLIGLGTTTTSMLFVGPMSPEGRITQTMVLGPGNASGRLEVGVDESQFIVRTTSTNSPLTVTLLPTSVTTGFPSTVKVSAGFGRTLVGSASLLVTLPGPTPVLDSLSSGLEQRGRPFFFRDRAYFGCDQRTFTRPPAFAPTPLVLAGTHPETGEVVLASTNELWGSDGGLIASHGRVTELHPLPGGEWLVVGETLPQLPWLRVGPSGSLTSLTVPGSFAAGSLRVGASDGGLFATRGLGFYEWSGSQFMPIPLTSQVTGGVLGDLCVLDGLVIVEHYNSTLTTRSFLFWNTRTGTWGPAQTPPANARLSCQGSRAFEITGTATLRERLTDGGLLIRPAPTAFTELAFDPLGTAYYLNDACGLLRAP